MKKTRGNFAVMARLVGLVRPLLGVMAGAVAMGVAGFPCARSFLCWAAGRCWTSLALRRRWRWVTYLPACWCLRWRAACCTMQSRRATTLSPLSFWRLSATKCSPPCGGWPPPGWRGGTRASLSPSSRRTLKLAGKGCSTRTPFRRYALRPLCLRQWPCLSAGITRRWACWRWPLTLWWAWRCHLPQPGAAGPRARPSARASAP